ncbi:MAG: hypothetical protein PVF73_04025 [Bacteroidales bacterium]|jgi:hypothetical protein
MKKNNLVFVSVLFLMVISCKLNRTTDKQDQAQQENMTEIVDLPEMKEITNDRFSFEFSIPVNWHAIDSSANGDGYFIDTGNERVDLRIYAEIFPPGNSMEIVESQCDSMAVFTFHDGHKGKVCKVNANELFIFRDNDVNRISLYIDAPENWITSNKLLIREIAGSLSFI